MSKFFKIFAVFLAFVWFPYAAPAHSKELGKQHQIAIEAQITHFYAWYLPATKKRGDPLRTDRETVQKFVSKALLTEIDKLIAEDDLDADYFTQAQDYFDDWEKSIDVGKVNSNGTGATAILVLGVAKQTQQRLSIALVYEDAAWKVRRVKRY